MMREMGIGMLVSPPNKIKNPPQPRWILIIQMRSRMAPWLVAGDHVDDPSIVGGL